MDACDYDDCGFGVVDARNIASCDLGYDDEPDGGDGGDGGEQGSACDEHPDCGVDLICNPNTYRCQASPDPFSVDRCELFYGDPSVVDCSTSTCLGSDDCPVGESCGVDTSGLAPRRVCVPSRWWNGPGIQPD